MGETLKWKDRLLSSSIPLEYEAAKILASRNIGVSFDFGYQRLDEKDEKDFSVDIKGYGFCPFKEESKIELIAQFLVECKHRNPNIKWLFLPDIHEGRSSHSSLTSPIKIIDEFSNYRVQNRFGSLPYDLETCLKGVEVNLQTGDVHETGIVHGVSQLTYGLTSIVKDHILSNLGSHIEDCYPTVICPILITTAELFITNKNFGLEKVAKSNNFMDLVKPVNFLTLYSNPFASFSTHCKNVFSWDYSRFTSGSNFSHFKELRKNKLEDIKKGYEFNSDPHLLLTSLSHGIETDFFREIIVCNFNAFPKLLTLIKKHMEKVNKHKVDLTKKSK